MAVLEQTAREKSVKVGDAALKYLEAGSGAPLLVLHGELGFPGWTDALEQLSKTRKLIIPLHPGFGVSDRIDWIMNVRDLSCFYARFLQEQNLAPIAVLGFSFGGWIAAEMAVNNAAQFSHMALVGAAGIRPPKGEIRDLFDRTTQHYIESSVFDPVGAPELSKLYANADAAKQYEMWEDARAETARLAWAPYLFNPSLPHLLAGIKGLRTLVMSGKDDKVVPSSAAEVYAASIKGAQLMLFDQCGHCPEIEKKDAFLGALTSFLASK